MKKIYLIPLTVIVIITGIYLGIRFYFLKSNDFKPDNTKATSVLDLRPSIIAKMQQLVKDGSGGLYHLSIEQVEPDILSSSLDIIKASLIPDPAVIKTLDSIQQLHDDVFKISFPAIHIKGIGIDDLLSTERLSLKQVSVTDPVIEVYHKKRGYNKMDTTTLYQKLLKTVKSISIDQVDISNATFISHHLSKDQTKQVNDISASIQDILIDSSTQYDKKRFLFGKNAELSVNNYSAKSPDGLYNIQLGSIKISGNEDKLTALNLEIRPALSKQKFQQRLSARKEMFNIKMPSIRLSGIDWWLLLNEGALTANEAVMENSRCSVYLDRSLPFRKVKQDNFPHQMLMQIPVPISISKIYMRNAQLTYTEFNPGMDKTGTIIIDKMNGEMTNVSNIPGHIRQHNIMTINSRGLFMKKISLTVGFQFNLSRYKTGDFSMNLQIKNVDSSTLNRITVPLAEFMLKKGTIQKGTAYVSGNNLKTHGKGELLYTDLYLVALKKDEDKPGNVDKQEFLSRLANTVLIKNDNPSSTGETSRQVDFDFEREPKLSFFSLVWKTIFIGILKTIGLPDSFADKSY